MSKELRALAEAATKGPWEFKRKWADHVASNSGDICILTDHLDTGFVRPLIERRNNAAYIAAVSPDVVLGLLDRIDQAAQPDCRTCKLHMTCFHDTTKRCTNGDKYQPSPPVVLWAAAKGGAL